MNKLIVDLFINERAETMETVEILKHVKNYYIYKEHDPYDPHDYKLGFRIGQHDSVKFSEALDAMEFDTYEEAEEYLNNFLKMSQRKENGTN